jgi:hypothetical protein
LEALEKIMLSTQNGILGSLRLIATMEEGANKTAAKDVLAEFRKVHELMRQRLFILKIWRKFDYMPLPTKLPEERLWGILGR